MRCELLEQEKDNLVRENSKLKRRLVEIDRIIGTGLQTGDIVVTPEKDNRIPDLTEPQS